MNEPGFNYSGDSSEEHSMLNLLASAVPNLTYTCFCAIRKASQMVMVYEKTAL